MSPRGRERCVQVAWLNLRPEDLHAVRAQRGDGARERAHAGEARGVVPDVRVEKIAFSFIDGVRSFGAPQIVRATPTWMGRNVLLHVDDDISGSGRVDPHRAALTPAVEGDVELARRERRGVCDLRCPGGGEVSGSREVYESGWVFYPE